MQVFAFQTPQVLASSSKSTEKKVPPVFALIDSVAFRPLVPRKALAPSSSSSLQCVEGPKLSVGSRIILAHALNVGAGSGGYEERQENNNQSSSVDGQHSDDSSKIKTSPCRIPYPFPIALLMCGCALVFLIVLFTKGPSLLLPALAKSGFTAAFSLIFVSEIGDKTFFIAALLAMQYEKVVLYPLENMQLQSFCCSSVSNQLKMHGTFHLQWPKLASRATKNLLN